MNLGSGTLVPVFLNGESSTKHLFAGTCVAEVGFASENETRAICRRRGSSIRSIVASERPGGFLKGFWGGLAREEVLPDVEIVGVEVGEIVPVGK